MKHHAVLFLAALLIVSFLHNISFAQITDSEAKPKLPENTFYFYFINGYALAYKFNNSQNSDSRLHLDFSSSYSDYHQNSDYAATSDKSMQTKKYYASRSDFSVTIEYIYLYNFYRSILGQAYIGTGPFISYSRFKSDENENSLALPFNTSYYISTDLSYGFSAGLSAFIGIEAFLSRNFRVFAETQLTGGRTWTKGENKTDGLYMPDYNKTESYSNWNSTRWVCNLEAVRIGIGLCI